MWTSNIKISFTMTVSYDKLNIVDRNLNPYNYDAILKALDNVHPSLPISFFGEQGNKKAGMTTSKPYNIQCDTEKQTITFTVDGVIYEGMTDGVVNAQDKDNTITDYDITGYRFMY